ncbi:MAG: FkbM family methyltransferase [Novosphingobium sp.]
MNSLQQIKQAWLGGDITREDFWRAMQDRHLRLREYQALIRETEVAQIEITGDELQVVHASGVRLVWYPEDLRTAPDVLVNSGAYEPEESAALLKAAAGAKVIFDVGANIGFYSLSWANGLAPGGTVHSFEPVPVTYDRLSRNIEINHRGDTVLANNFALGSEKSTVTIFLPAFSGSSASSLKNLHPEEESVEVEAQVETLDAYFAARGLDRLDFMKIDVEGAELLVLQGGRETLARHKPLLFMELLRKWAKPFGYHPNDVIALLGELGYKCYSHQYGKLARFTEMTDESVETNFFFAHPDHHGAWMTAMGLAA